MAKLFKNKDKLVMYIPFEVISGMNLKEGDDVDFFRYNQNSFIFAKKSDITDMILGKKPAEERPSAQSIERFPAEELSSEEIAVLKKLDTLKYGMRSKENVVKMLDKEERITLKGLMKKKAVSLFAKDKSKEALFSISKGVYDKYLMRKKMGEQQSAQPARSIAAPEQKTSYQRPQMQSSAPAYGIENENVKTLEKEGFIVLQYEAEASALSLALEQSIRRGMVLGTRSFNKKFYIIMRSYFDRHGAKILKALKDGELKVAQIAKEVGIDEDGARAILYLLAESGDVSEKKKDLFTLA
ncbi:MAG: hypothetical protein KGH71_03395 [Candidatus Micrarchaeota archaeon]|nr:hypothetical protein [Candidatus Micrarchaeota archaeon]